MTRHIEITINFDLTCWGQDAEDFENDDEEIINEAVADYIVNDSTNLLEDVIVKKVWYEEDQKGEKCQRKRQIQ